jgi:hypothetical protein
VLRSVRTPGESGHDRRMRLVEMGAFVFLGRQGEASATSSFSGQTATARMLRPYERPPTGEAPFEMGGLRMGLFAHTIM